MGISIFNLFLVNFEIEAIILSDKHFKIQMKKISGVSMAKFQSKFLKVSF